MTPHPPIRLAIIGAGFLAETRARCYAQVHGYFMSRLCVFAPLR